MPKKIFKYEIALVGRTRLKLESRYDEPLFAKMRGRASINLWFDWADTDTPETKKEDCYFEVFATGQEIPESAEWMVTVEDEGYIWHVYKVFPTDEEKEKDWEKEVAGK